MSVITINFLLRLLPFLGWAKQTTLTSARQDALAGLTGAIIVLPQGVAYALIAGLPPEYGLYAAIVPATIAALFGSSWHLISGPTAALSIVVFTTISPLAEAGSASYITLVLSLTLMAGLFQLLLSLARMGTLVNFVSHSVVVGFTSGAAVVIATSQIKNSLGLDLASSGNFMVNWIAVSKNISATHLPSLVITLITLVTLIGVKRWRKKWPNMLIAMVVGSLATQLMLLTPWQAAQSIALVGEIPSQLPPLSAPLMDWDILRELAPGAMALGLLGLVEAVSIARSVATRSGQRIDGNQEFIGQSLSNIIGSFTSSYATSGSFTRTGVNYEAGATSPLAALFAAIFLALIVLLFAPLAAFITLPSMAAILLVVAWNLIDWHHIKIIYRAGKNEAMVFGVTFGATLLLPMEFAIYLGVLLSLVLYLRRTSKPNITTMARSTGAKKLVSAQRSGLPECESLKIIRINGSIFFGAVDYVQSTLMSISQKHVLIVASGINFIDLAGTELLANEAKRLTALGGGLYICNPNGRVIKPIIRNGHLNAIGKRHIFATKTLALSTIDTLLAEHTCEGCAD
ncbi:MAG: SulP family inorganic anion transporter [Oceanospirillaceae bacterium]|jgi:SulP family sulfate permease|nr:SulP family inorganic anion transporter [Oceanospirillaceae bacterium]MBT4443900.1 SulP family inorganic anion transporter [Oceanospirillaceae bacterium]MBT6078405.1 SulP family inorganic anion transporter [Oceanospirillaceae bacterium]